MTHYTNDELVSSSVISKNFWAYLSKITNHELEKIWVLKNNKLDAVIISSDIYDFFQDLLEHAEIYDDIKERIEQEEFVNWEEVLKKFNLSVK